MKKILCLFVFIILLVVNTSCNKTKCLINGHYWDEATCTKSKRCIECGLTVGKALGHKISEATCTDYSYCKTCGVKLSDALGHNSNEATCEEDSICKTCNEILENSYGHDANEPTCEEDSICKTCDKLLERHFKHDYVKENDNTPGVCTKCDKTDFSELEKYSDIPYDKDLAVSIRMVENRKSKYYTGNQKKLGEHEKSIFDLQVTLVKLQTKKAIDNIKIYVVAKTVDNGYIYKDYSSSSKKMGEYTYTSVTSFATFATKEFTNENYLLNKTPEKIYVRVTYTNENIFVEQELTYKVSVINQDNINFDNFKKRNIISNNATSNPSYVDPKEDPVRIKLTKDEATEKSKLGSVKEDSVKIQFNVLKENLNKYKLDDDTLKANKLISIELPKDSNAYDAWDIYPEIKEVKIEVYAKIKSTDKDFSEYVKIYSIYGFLSKYRDLSIATAKFDESFEVEDIYVVVEGELHNATKDTFSSLFSCKYSELIKVE